MQAVDRNGTPTAVPGLSWDTPEGRVRHVRMPRDGEYVAEYVPDRIREPQRHVLAVMASQALRADAALDVTPPPIRVIAAARVGLFYNFGHAVGPAAFLEAMRPVRDAPPAAAAGRNGRLHARRDRRHRTGADGRRRGSRSTRFPSWPLARARLPLRDAVRGVRRARRGDDAGAHQALNTVDRQTGFDANGSAYAPGGRRRRRRGADAEARTAGVRATLSLERAGADFAG